MPVIALLGQGRLKLLLRPPKQSPGFLCQSAQFLVQAPCPLEFSELIPNLVCYLLVRPDADYNLLGVAAEPQFAVHRPLPSTLCRHEALSTEKLEVTFT